MRKLLYFGAGFCCACLLGAYMLETAWLYILGAISLCAAAALMLLFPEAGWRRKTAFVLLGLALGMLWFGLYSSFILDDAKQLDGKTKMVAATALDYGVDSSYGTAVPVELDREYGSYRCRLYLDEQLKIVPGDRIQGEFKLCYTGAQGERESVYYSGSGVFLLGYQRSEMELTQGENQTVKHFPARMRRAILEKIDSLFPQDTSAFAKALLLGETSEIDYQTDSALTTAGIVHVVSVSGLHVSILLAVLFLFLGRRRFLTPILGACVLILIAAVTGFSASVVRSCLMNGLMLLALMLNREYDPLTALAFALLVMLGINPLSITSAGLQLSAASVLGISLFAMPVSDWISSWNFWAELRYKSVPHRCREWFATTTGVSLGATVATAPLTALHFGTVSLIGGLTNLLTLWIVNIVFVGIMVCAIVGTLWAKGGILLAWLLSWAIRFVLYTAKLLSRFPLAAVYTESPYITVWLVAAYVLLTVFLLMKRKRRFQLCFWTILTLGLAVALSWAEPRLDDFRMTVIDVGQGQCVLLHSDDRTYMVDCGGSRDKSTADKAVATLFSQGIFRLDGLILTHYDRDHAGAAQYLLTRVPVDRVYLPLGEDASQWEPDIRKETSGETVLLSENAVIAWEDTRITLFAFGMQETSNESSTCVLFQRENCDILITGDQSQLGETALLSQYSIPALDVLVVGHHGSNSSTSAFLLEQTRPSVAVISVGAGNYYGHPSPQVLERLTQFECQIRRTDLEGTIIIKR